MKLTGKGNISAEIIADSTCDTEKRITTFVLEYPRFIHAEMLTHRLFSRNAASSRAIPVKAMLELIEQSPAMPIHWGKNQPGMQAKEECNAPFKWESGVGGHGYMCGEDSREEKWQQAARQMIKIAKEFADAGYHKQIVNRLLEPFQMIRVIVTATEWDNFFHLRYHEMAQPEIAHLAELMYKIYVEHTPNFLEEGEWHLPFIQQKRVDGEMVYFTDTYEELSLEDAQKISASACAQVSYRKTDLTLEKARDIYAKLIESQPVHASPVEHQATPITYSMLVDIESNDKIDYELLQEQGITHVDTHGNFWSGNFQGWIQHRQLIPHHTCWNFEKESS